MKMYEAAIFLLIINFSFGIIGVTGVFRTSFPNEMEGRVDEDLLNQNLQGGGGVLGFISDTLTYSEYYADAIALFLGMFFSTTFGLPMMLYNEPFNFPLVWVMMLSSVMAMIYAGGIITLLRGVNPED